MRIWMDILVAAGLVAVLIAGGALIWSLNFDAMEVELDDEQARRGQEISKSYGCIACHTVDGSPGVGPSWLGMYGGTRMLEDGSSVVVDEAYFRESIRRPQAKLVAGYPDVMVTYGLMQEDEIQALLAFARQLSDEAQ